MLVDSHCHLDFPDFENELDDVIQRAKGEGVDLMVTICTRVSKFNQVLAIAERFPNIYCSVGIHPHEAEREPAVDVETLVKLADHPKVIGIGETGLDYFYMHSDKDAQISSFKTHIGAARETGLPLIVHTRDADADMMSILSSEYEAGAFPGLIHCFSSGTELAKCVLDLNFSLAFSGIVTFKKAEEIQAVAQSAPDDRILVETDSPYLAPIPKRGKRNEPSYVRHTAAKLAELRGVSPEQIAQATTDNFYRLFSKVKQVQNTP